MGERRPAATTAPRSPPINAAIVMPTTIGVDLEAKSSTTLAYTQEGTIVVSETEIEIESNLSCTSLEARREDTAAKVISRAPVETFLLSISNEPLRTPRKLLSSTEDCLQPPLVIRHSTDNTAQSL
jgi:hypothetical protein